MLAAGLEEIHQHRCWLEAHYHKTEDAERVQFVRLRCANRIYASFTYTNSRSQI